MQFTPKEEYDLEEASTHYQMEVVPASANTAED